MSPFVTYDEYLDSLSRLSIDADPTIDTADTIAIREAAESLYSLPIIDRKALADWAVDNSMSAHVLGLVLGMSQERLKNTMRDLFETSSIRQQSTRDAGALIDRLDQNFDLVRLLTLQLNATYGFGDVLVARAGSRVRANAAANSGRALEDEIEAIVKSLGLPYQTRTRFVGRNGQTGPCDVVISSREKADIIVAAKGFDSTGSKQSAAVDEIKLVAEVRLPHQFVCVVMDGMGWKARQGDLRKIYGLWESDHINGLYSRRTLDRFRDDVVHQARLRNYSI